MICFKILVEYNIHDYDYYLAIADIYLYVSDNDKSIHGYHGVKIKNIQYFYQSHRNTTFIKFE